MNITLDKQTATNGVIKISLTPEDYQPKVDTVLKDYSKKAVIKGFRQGKVPASVIKKMYGKSVLIEEVNTILSDSLNQYIVAQKLNLVGNPIPVEDKMKVIDWDNPGEYQFEFEVGMADEFELPPFSDIKLTRYKITATPEEVDEVVKTYQKEYGEMVPVDLSSKGDVLKGTLTPQGGDQGRDAVIPIDDVLPTAVDQFVGLKPGDTVSFNIDKVTEDAKVRATILGAEQEEGENQVKEFDFMVNDITTVEPAKLEQPFFDKLLGPDTVKSEEEFRDKIKEYLEKRYEQDTEQWLDSEVERFLLKHTKVTLPEDFMKSWLKSVDDQLTDERLEAEFNMYVKSTQWQMILQKLGESHQVEVTQDDIFAHTKGMIAAQFGGMNVDDERLNEWAANYLMGKDGKGKMYQQTHQKMWTAKIIQLIKDQAPLSETSVTADEFKKIVSERMKSIEEESRD